MGSLLSYCCSLLSSLLSLLCSLSGRYGARKGWFPSGGFIAGPLAASSGLSALFSLLSSFCSLLSLLSSLFCRCHSFLRSHFAPAPFDLRIRPSTSPPTASTLCGTIPGPAECAKRLNNNNKYMIVTYNKYSIMINLLIFILIMFISSLRAFRRARGEPQRVEAVGGDVDGLMQRSKGQVRSAF